MSAYLLFKYGRDLTMPVEPHRPRWSLRAWLIGRLRRRRRPSWVCHFLALCILINAALVAALSFLAYLI